VTCQAVRRIIAAYVDGELGGAQRLDVERHLSACSGCQHEEAALLDLGALLRQSAALTPMPADGLRGLAGGVISRISAEDQQSFRARWARLFEDWHWLAIGSGAFGAAFATVFLVFSVLYSPVTEARQFNERVGTLYLMAVPEDGLGEPVMMEFERSMGTPKGDHRYAVPASFGWKAGQALVAALDKSLMKHGGTVSFQDLPPEYRDEVASLLREIARLHQLPPSRPPGGVTNVSGMHLHVSEFVTAAGL
jgi:hypothetical protein